MKRMTEMKLVKSIMDFWQECICKDAKADLKINDLLENFIRECEASYFYDDLERSVL